jgi:putative ABC transport system permease protein
MLNGMTNSFNRSVSSLGADVLFVGRFPWMSFDDYWKYRNRKEISIQQVRELERQLTTAQAVSPQAESFGLSLYQGNRRAKSIWLVGNAEQSLMIRGLTVAQGRWISDADVSSARPVCVLGSFLADRFFPGGGALGQKVRVENTTFEIIGVLEKQGSLLGWNQDNQVVIPVTRFAQDFFDKPDYVIAVKAKNPELVLETKEEIRGIMRRLRRVEPGRPDDFAINQQDAITGFFGTFRITLGSFGLFVTLLSLFVGGIGIMNIMFVSVVERTKEIGIRKALGAKRRTILIQFLIEAASITLGAGLIGLAIAWPITWWLSEVARKNDSMFTAEMSWWIVVLALGISVLTGVIAGFIPAWRASRMDPVDALRSE